MLIKFLNLLKSIPPKPYFINSVERGDNGESYDSDFIDQPNSWIYLFEERLCEIMEKDGLFIPDVEELPDDCYTDSYTFDLYKKAIQRFDNKS
jgi:hypothetical protein